MAPWDASWKEFSGNDAVLPELPVVGWKAPRVAWHMHYGRERRLDRWSLILRLRGAMSVVWEDEPLVVPGGHALIIPPGVENGAEGSSVTPGTVAFLALIDQPLPGVESAIDRRLRAGLRALPRICTCPPGIEGLVLDLLDAHRASSDPLRTWACRNRLHRFLHALIQIRAAPPAPPPAVQRALAVMQHSDAPLPVTALARAVGLDRAVFTRRFTAACGTSPAAWMRTRRIARAKALLRRGLPVTSVAATLGFSSSQHLADAFRHAVGVAPTAWLREQDGIIG